MIYKALVFDLDDTLIDTRFRHYKVLADYVLSKQLQMLNFYDYVSIRKEKGWTNEQVLRNYFNFNFDDFKLFWQNSIESKEYFIYDVEIASEQLLEQVKTKNNLVYILLSLRSNIDLAKQQFENCSFSSLFEDVIFCRHDTVNPKIFFLKELKDKYSDILFVGDTESDESASLQAGVNFWGVSTGIYPLHAKNIFVDINHLLLNILK
jgi:phosphoglycolate phosphatase-like HAD superfamily hydrolase